MPAATSSRLVSVSESPLIQHLLAAFQSPEISRRMALVVNLLLITLMAWLVADLTWQLLPASETDTKTATAMPLNTSKRIEKPSMANVVVLHLLGESKSSASKKTSGPIKAPDTHLRLTLHGVFASENPELSLAIISEKNGKDKTYRQGDSLPNGVLLHEIYADRVILSRNGKFETLRLIRKQANIKVSSRSPALPGAGELHQSSRISQFKKTYKKDPQSLWKQIRISPVMKNGRIEGYRFSHNDRALMKDLGLQPQDIITAINGTAVTDTAQLMEMMGDIGNMSELTLSLRRNGQTKDITVRFD